MYIRFEFVAHRSPTMMAFFILLFWFIHLLDTHAASAGLDLRWFYPFLGGWVMKCKVWVGGNYGDFV